MNSHAIDRNTSVLPSLLAIILGVSLGLFLAWILGSSMQAEWFIACLVALSLPLFICLSGNVERFFMFLLIITLVLNIDVTVNRTEHIGGAAGFIFSLHNVALLGILAVWGIETVKNKMHPLTVSVGHLLPLLLLLVCALLSFFSSKRLDLSLFEFIELVKMGLIFICVAAFIVKTKDIELILIGVLIGLSLEILIGFAQVIFDSTFGLTALGMRQEGTHFMLGAREVHRVSGTLGSTNGLAWYLDFILPIPLALIFVRLRHFLRLGLLFILGTGCAVLLWTYSREGWIGFLIGSIFIIIAVIHRLSPMKRFYISFILCLIIGSAIFLLAIIPNPVRSRFTQDDEGAAYVRLPLMKVAATMIVHNPWVGVGLNNYTEVDQDYDYTDEKVTLVFPQPVHNVYLQLGAEIGIPGLVCFLWFVGLVILRGFYVLNRSDGLILASVLGMMGGLAAFLSHGLVSNGSIASYHFLPFWFFSGVILGLHRRMINEQDVKDSSVAYETV